ncbi:efflux RND transporter periplasmic adaptor subunit [Bartonella sp. DGB1]|uniref:efflux RND transporter periplasmic adaptor subunit n=1 Tax=Bartonella sp. DGB1 TaxID=3239807 RepID=UPI0035266C2E
MKLWKQKVIIAFSLLFFIFVAACQKTDKDADGNLTEGGSAIEQKNTSDVATVDNQPAKEGNSLEEKKSSDIDTADNQSVKENNSVEGKNTPAVAAENTAKEEKSTKNAKYKYVEFLKSEILTVKLEDVYDEIPVYGTLKPQESVQVTASILGKVSSVNVDIGDKVTKGDTLVVFNKDNVTSSLSSAEASVEGIKSQLKNARSTYERSKELNKQGYVSKAAVLNNEATVANLVSQLRKAEAANVQAARQLSEASVVAPVSGIVASKAVNVGQTVGVGSVLLTLVDISKMEFQANIPSTEISNVKLGQEASLSVFGIDKKFIATVNRISPVVVQNTRSIPVYFSVDNPDYLLRGGMYADGFIMVNVQKNIMVLPNWSVLYNKDEKGNLNYFVVMLKDGKIAVQDVEVGDVWESKSLIQIKSGLKVGDQVVITNLEQDYVGASYKIIDL